MTVRVGESVRLDHRYTGESAKQWAKGVDRSVYWSQAHHLLSTLIVTVPGHSGASGKLTVRE